MTETKTTTFTVTITAEARARSIEMLLTNGTNEGIDDGREMLLELCNLYDWVTECPLVTKTENNTDD